MIYGFLSSLGEFLGSAICHRLEERSFNLNGYYLPLCARCTGMYIGFLVSSLYFFIIKRNKADKPPDVKSALLIFASLLPLAFDGITSYMGLRETNNIIRFVTGALFTSSLPILFILLRNFTSTKENNVPIIKHKIELMFPFIISLLLVPFVWLLNMKSYLFGMMASLLVSISIVFTIIYIIWSFVYALRPNKQNIIISISLSASFFAFLKLTSVFVRGRLGL